jgi:NAD(P)-dependent dehydrogenase (short-subunit alcohol dehydrogenase family)
MAVNLRSQMLTCKHAIPEMVRTGGGSIINMSSGASLKGDRTRTAYGVSKAGVNTLTMYVATSHGKQGVRVNTIVPGLIITDAVRAHLTEKHAGRPGPGDVSRRTWVSPRTSPTSWSSWRRTSRATSPGR